MKLFLVAALALISLDSFAAVRPFYQDVKLPTQKMIEHQAITNPAAAGTVDVLSAHAGATSAAIATVTTFVAQPDVARNLVITPTGTTGDVEACTVVVNGRDYLNNVIAENFAFLANASTATTGNKAFKSVSSVVFPANCESGGFAATWGVGYGEKLGVKRCMDKAGHILFSTLNGSKEGTAPTMAADASVVSLNTADFVGTMNGSNDFELLFLQNFRCVN